MNDVPLVKANNIHDINTSIIAIKKQLKQLNEAVGLIDMPTIDTSIFVKKSEVVDVVEADNMNPVTSNAVAEVADSLEPVDEVTSGNMHSVSSNAVANAISMLGTEEECGSYFGNKRYHKTFYYGGINLVANEDYVLNSSFEISINKAVKVDAFIINDNVWSNNVRVFILSNGTLAIASSLSGNGFTAVIEVYYIK